jgi:multidrug efflux pump subunit AcrA (membrane-fusion protein)
MAAPPIEACPACAGLRARAEQAEAQLSEVQAQLAKAQAQLAAIQTQRVSRRRRKRPASPSPDWLLVEEVRGLLALSVGDLATRLGLNYSTVLGKAQEKPLSPGLRDKLLALKREHQAAKP